MLARLDARAGTVAGEAVSQTTTAFAVAKGLNAALSVAASTTVGVAAVVEGSVGVGQALAPLGPEPSCHLPTRTRFHGRSRGAVWGAASGARGRRSADGASDRRPQEAMVLMVWSPETVLPSSDAVSAGICWNLRANVGIMRTATQGTPGALPQLVGGKGLGAAGKLHKRGCLSSVGRATDS